MNDDVKVPEAQPEDEILEDCEGVCEDVTTAVELIVFRGEVEMLTVPEPQKLLLTEALGVFERDCVRVVDRESVGVRVEVVDTLCEPLGARELLPQEVGESEGKPEVVTLEEGEGEGVKEEARLGVAPPPKEGLRVTLKDSVGVPLFELLGEPEGEPWGVPEVPPEGLAISGVGVDTPPEGDTLEQVVGEEEGEAPPTKEGVGASLALRESVPDPL